jgi:hypothetical protein
VANCTTKMLLGFPCFARVEEELDAGRAISIVRAAGFVDLTERFADSLLLFRRTFDFDTRAHAAAFGGGAPAEEARLRARGPLRGPRRT